MRTKTICPNCGKNHQYQHMAQQCFQEVLMGMDMIVIADNKLSADESQTKSIMKMYYKKLPIHTKYIKLQQAAQESN